MTLAWRFHPWRLGLLASPCFFSAVLSQGLQSLTLDLNVNHVGLQGIVLMVQVACTRIASRFLKNWGSLQLRAVNLFAAE